MSVNSTDPRDHESQGAEPVDAPAEHADAEFIARLSEGLARDRIEDLHDRLVTSAQVEGLLDVAYRTVDSPVGDLLIATTEAGLVRVAYPNQGHDAVLESIAEQVSPRILLAPRRLDDVARQLD